MFCTVPICSHSFLSISGRCSLTLIGDFTRAYGSVLNHAKYYVKFFRRWRDRTDVPTEFSLSNWALKILGDQFETSGWNRSIAVVQNKLGMWRESLSLIDKVLVLKVLRCIAISFISRVPIASLSEKASSEVSVSVHVGWQARVGHQGKHALPHRGGRQGDTTSPLKLDTIFVSFVLTELAHAVIHPSGYLLRVFFSKPGEKSNGVV